MGLFRRNSYKELAEVTSELLAAHHHLDAFFNLSRDIFMIVTEDGTIVRVNPRWEEVLGYTQEEVRGTPFQKYVVPDDAERTARRLAENLERDLDDGVFTNTYRSKDGKLVELEWRSAKPAEGYIHAVARIIGVNDGGN